MTPDDPLRPASITLDAILDRLHVAQHDGGYWTSWPMAKEAITAAFTAGQMHVDEANLTLQRTVDDQARRIIEAESKFADAEQEIFNLRGAFDIKARLVERAEALRAGQQPTPPADQEPL